MAKFSQSSHLLCSEEICVVELRSIGITDLEVSSRGHSLDRLLYHETATALPKADKLLQSLVLMFLPIAFHNLRGGLLLRLLYYLILVEIGGVEPPRAINFL